MEHVRGMLIWRCDSCRVPVVRGKLYLLTNGTWHARHPIKCHPKNHERATVASIPVQQIRWTDQFNWWMSLIEAEAPIDMFKTNWMSFLNDFVSIPSGWRPERVDLFLPCPVGVQ